MSANWRAFSPSLLGYLCLEPKQTHADLSRGFMLVRPEDMSNASWCSLRASLLSTKPYSVHEDHPPPAALGGPQQRDEGAERQGRGHHDGTHDVEHCEEKEGGRVRCVKARAESLKAPYAADGAGEKCASSTNRPAPCAPCNFHMLGMDLQLGTERTLRQVVQSGPVQHMVFPQRAS
jgi:hypothetical protein